MALPAAAKLQRFRICVEFFGPAFHGWQRLSARSGLVSVTSVLEEALDRSGAGKLRGAVVGAGRTDAGVHALAQVAHFDFEPHNSALDGDVMRRLINFWLPASHRKSVHVTDCLVADPAFHARYDCVARCYSYRIAANTRSQLFQSSLAWQIPHRLDLDRVQAAVDLLSGEHDFAAFRAQGCTAQSSVRTLRLSLAADDGHLAHSLRAGFGLSADGAQNVVVRAESRSFLFRQVRLLVGALVDVGHGRRSLADLRDSLASGKQTKPLRAAPAHGLFFVAAKFA